MIHKSVKVLKVCLIACVVTLLAGCTRRSGHSASTPTDEGGIVFRFIPTTAPRWASGKEAVFQFRNDSASDVHLPCYFGQSPKDGFLRVTYTKYAFQVKGEWKFLDGGADTLPEQYSLEPGGELRLLIPLDPFEWQSIPRNVPVRVKVKNFTSEPFTLDAALGTEP